MKHVSRQIIVFLFISLLSTTFKINAQEENNALKTGSDELTQLFKELYNKDNQHKTANINDKIIKKFNTLLHIPESFDYPFDTLKQTGKITSPDEKVRIFSWYVKDGDNYECYGIVQHKTRKNAPPAITILVPHEYNGKNFNEETFTAKNWPGMLYYKIIPVTINKKEYYTLLGFSFDGILTNQKIIDIMGFDDQNIPFFGYPLFDAGKTLKKRVVFTYSAQVVMSLTYNEGLKMIIYDHLAPQRPSLTGKYEFYGPDGSFDGFKFEDDKWKHISNVDIRSPQINNRRKAPEPPSSDNLSGQ